MHPNAYLYIVYLIMMIMYIIMYFKKYKLICEHYYIIMAVCYAIVAYNHYLEHKKRLHDSYNKSMQIFVLG